MAKEIEIVDHANVYAEPNGYYVFQHETPIMALCADCAKVERTESVFAGADFEPLGAGETDTPTHCEKCEALIIENLTSDGVEYVREALAENTRRPEVLAAWREAFAAYL